MPARGPRLSDLSKDLMQLNAAKLHYLSDKINLSRSSKQFRWIRWEEQLWKQHYLVINGQPDRDPEFYRGWRDAFLVRLAQDQLAIARFQACLAGTDSDDSSEV